MTNLNDYVGIPYKLNGKGRSDGVDCYGLAKLYYKEVFGKQIKFSFLKEGSDPFLKHLANLSIVEDRVEIEGDILTFIIPFFEGTKKLYDYHAGIAVKEAKLLLHTSKGTGSIIEPIKNYNWLKYRRETYRIK